AASTTGAIPTTTSAGGPTASASGQPKAATSTPTSTTTATPMPSATPRPCARWSGRRTSNSERPPHHDEPPSGPDRDGRPDGTLALPRRPPGRVEYNRSGGSRNRGQREACGGSHGGDPVGADRGRRGRHHAAGRAHHRERGEFVAAGRRRG